MIKIAADSPKYNDCGTQTDCQVNSCMAHLLTQVDSRNLQDFANTNVSKLLSTVSQIRLLEEQDEAQNQREQESRQRKSLKKSKSVKGKGKTQGPGAGAPRGGMDSVFRQLLEQLEAPPMTLKEVVEAQNENIAEYVKYVSQAL